LQDIQKRNARHCEKTGRVYILSGLITCPSCGGKLVGAHCKSKATQKSYFSYRCNHNTKNKTCTNRMSLSEIKLEKQLLDNLEQYVLNEEIRVKEISEKNKPAVNNTKKIAAIKKEMERLNKMYRKGNIEEDEYDAEFAVLRKDLKMLEAAMEKPKEKDFTALKKLVESDYRTIYEALDREHRKAFWRNIIKEFTVGEDRKIIPESIVFF
jgi:rRNA maturation protein Nop10